MTIVEVSIRAFLLVPFYGLARWIFPGVNKRGDECDSARGFPFADLICITEARI